MSQSLLTAEDLEVYRRAARKREAQRLALIDRRRERAMRTASEAALLLKRDFGASRVVLFGSVAGDGVFHERSDIDLAVDGIAPADFWRAWAALDRVSTEFEIDLVDLRFASPSLVRAVVDRGDEL